MVYLELGMWEILDVLRRFNRRESKSAIEAATGRQRKTIARYVRLAEQLGWRAGEAEPDEELARGVLLLLTPGPKKKGDVPVENPLLPHREEIGKWLSLENSGGPLKLTKVHRLLGQKGVNVSYCRLYRFAKEQFDFGAIQTTVRMADVAPGESAEVDFGRLGPVYDPSSGRNRITHALIITLAHSRHQYIYVTCTQTVVELIEGLENAWEFFGGVPARVVLDNLKAAVTKADRYDPIFQRTFAEYAEYRGFIIDAAVPNHPKGKPRVERSVQYVRENFFRGQEWLNVAHVQREADIWCLQVAGTRKHGTTGKQPLKVFEEVEKATLKSCSSERFDPPRWAECKVHPDHHIQFNKALYSVPTIFVGKKVVVRGDRKLVRIYSQGEIIKTHAAQDAYGKSTDYNDYPKELAAYAMRDPIRIIKEAQTKGEHIGAFAQALLAGSFPWSKLRQAQKLLRLVDKYGTQRVDEACSRAIDGELYNVQRLERIIMLNLRRQAPSTSESHAQPRPAKFLRPPGSFSPQPPKENKHGDQSVT